MAGCISTRHILFPARYTVILSFNAALPDLKAPGQAPLLPSDPLSLSLSLSGSLCILDSTTCLLPSQICQLSTPLLLLTCLGWTATGSDLSLAFSPLFHKNLSVTGCQMRFSP